MRLINIDNVMAVMDENEVKKIFTDDLEKIKKVENWAVKGLPLDKNESHFWPIIGGKIFSWSYSYDHVRSAVKLLTEFGRDFSFYVVPHNEMPLLIKIEKYAIDKTQKYLIIAPRVVTIDEDAYNEHEPKSVSSN